MTFLKSNKIKVHSFSSELKYNGKRFVSNLKLTVEEQCRFIDEKINDLLEIENKFNPRVIPCSKCNNGYMIFKITPNKRKELYECQTCKNVIWVK